VSTGWKAEFRCPFVSFIEFTTRRLIAPESTHFHPFEARRCPEPLQTRLLLALAWTTGDVGSRDALSPCSQVLRHSGLSVFAAFVACSFPPRLSARGKPRDLRDLSPIPADIRLYCAPLHGAPDEPSSQHSLEPALFASVVEEMGNQIGVKPSSLALHLSNIWPDCSN
jgi:hypothetical protein